MDVQQKISSALQLHQSGHLLEAGEIYREVLAVDANNVDALNLLGVVMQAVGDLDLAIDLIGRATDLAPDYFAPFANLGNAFQAANRLDEALEAFRTALALDPDSAETANNLASVFNQQGRHAEALSASEAALKLIPDFPAAAINRGNALVGIGQAEKAVAVYLEVLAKEPSARGGWYNLGNAYFDLSNWPDAIEAYQKALELDTSTAQLPYNLALCLIKNDRYEEAVVGFSEALKLRPGFTDAECNRASALRALGRTEDAIANLKRALIDEPESADLHRNLALNYLQQGEFENGWKEFEWRWETPEFAELVQDLQQPRWQGEPLEDKTILVTVEHGIEDEIRFARYVSLLQHRGARVVLECSAPLTKVFATLPGVGQCIDRGLSENDVDFFVPLLSLPHVFATTMATIPCSIPYLSTPPEIRPHEIVHQSDEFKIGFAWAVRSDREDNNKQSCDVRLFEQLFLLPGIRFFSLQAGECREALQSVKTKAAVIDIVDTLDDFADTAAVIDAMDMIVSVDSSVLHLAGALGKPALGLMSRPAEYLWMDERTDSPWYPSLKLIRQPSPGDWASVFNSAEMEIRTKMVEFLDNGR